jgi:hypothetical protein
MTKEQRNQDHKAFVRLVQTALILNQLENERQSSTPSSR